MTGLRAPLGTVQVWSKMTSEGVEERKREKFTASADSLLSTDSSQLRLIGRGVPKFSYEFADVQILCDPPPENPRSPNDRPRD